MLLASIKKQIIFVLILILALFFVFPSSVSSAQSERRVVGRICDINIAIVGATGRDANTGRLNICTITPLDDYSHTYRKFFRYKHGDTISIRSIYNYFKSIDEEQAKNLYEESEQAQGRMYTTEGGRFASYSDKNSEDFICGTLDKNSFNNLTVEAKRDIKNKYGTVPKMMPISSIDDYTLSPTSKCPRVERIAKDQIGDSSYFIRYSISDKGPLYKKNEESSNSSTKDIANKLSSNLNQLSGGSTVSNPSNFIGKIITTILQLAGTAALLMFIYGGLLIMISQGKSEKYEKGAKTMMWSALGIIVMLSSYAILDFILKGFGA